MKKLGTYPLFAVLSLAVLLWFGIGWIAYHKIVHRTKIWSISDTFGGDPVTIRASDQFAGAIFSLTWRGMEFIESSDHGRELQSAAQFNGLRECYNPTEAGANADSGGRWSSSRLLSISAEANTLQTRARMAFWLSPGEASPSCPGGAKNTAVLSDHQLAKRIRISGNIVSHDMTFDVPRHYKRAAFEVITAYLPKQFDTFWSYDAQSDTMDPLSNGPGGHPQPVVISTKDRRFALGIFSAGLPQAGYPTSGYGRQRFEAEQVSKWSCVYRLNNVPPGSYRFRCFTVVGNVDEVKATMRALMNGQLVSN